MTAPCLRLEPETDELAATLAQFASADAALLADRSLLRRTDTKFVVAASRVPAIVGALARDYAIVRMPFELALYRSLYFDTPDLRCFHDHRRGRRIRHKIRIRHYPDRRLSFLEVKARRGETITDKQRLEIADGQRHLGALHRAFLRTHVPYADALEPRLWVDYRRITLVGLHAPERVTIDLDLELARLDGTRCLLGTAAVIEVKQASACASPMLHALAAAHVRAGSTSKYITAIARVHPELRPGRLLPNLRSFERMS